MRGRPGEVLRQVAAVVGDARKARPPDREGGQKKVCAPSRAGARDAKRPAKISERMVRVPRTSPFFQTRTAGGVPRGERGAVVGRGER